MDPSVITTAGINISPFYPSSFSSIPGMTTTINLAINPFVAITTIIPLSNTQHVINLKLTNTNYLFWRMQMKLYLIGQGVFSFIDWLTTYPSPHDLSSNASAAFANFNYGPSQTFLTWKQQDQLLSALLSDTTKRLMSSLKCRSVKVINNPTRLGSNQRG